MRSRGRGARGRFPPSQIAEIKALACELSRWSHAELAKQAVKRGIICSVSGTTVWRYLAQDAIRPWAWRSWIFPRDPDFAAKAGRVLDLYERRWEGKPSQRSGVSSPMSRTRPTPWSWMVSPSITSMARAVRPADSWPRRWASARWRACCSRAWASPAGRSGAFWDWVGAWLRHPASARPLRHRGNPEASCTFVAAQD